MFKCILFGHTNTYNEPLLEIHDGLYNIHICKRCSRLYNHITKFKPLRATLATINNSGSVTILDLDNPELTLIAIVVFIRNNVETITHYRLDTGAVYRKNAQPIGRRDILHKYTLLTFKQFENDIVRQLNSQPSKSVGFTLGGQLNIPSVVGSQSISGGFISSALSVQNSNGRPIISFPGKLTPVDVVVPACHNRLSHYWSVLCNWLKSVR